MYPFRLEPVCKDYVWGGTLLHKWGKGLGLERVAESWELSAHPDGDVRALDGPLAGKRLSQIAEGPFPVIVKLINSRLPLSIQVHPNDDYAAKFENDSGKDEMWYVIDHEPDAFIYLGFREKCSTEEAELAIKGGVLPDMLRKIRVRKGDRFFIPAGTVHSIGGGILLAEVQRNSNVTYRVFDYGRGRELHVKKALDVMKTEPADLGLPGSQPARELLGGKIEVLAGCEHFCSCILTLNGQCEVDQCCSLLCLDGEASLGDLKMEKGACALVPQDATPAVLNGKAEFLMVNADMKIKTIKG